MGRVKKCSLLAFFYEDQLDDEVGKRDERTSLTTKSARGMKCSLLAFFYEDQLDDEVGKRDEKTSLTTKSARGMKCSLLAFFYEDQLDDEVGKRDMVKMLKKLLVFFVNSLCSILTKKRRMLIYNCL
ncbi:MAG: hypothetical protein ACI4D8_00635 [Wujia sp.]